MRTPYIQAKNEQETFWSQVQKPQITNRNDISAIQQLKYNLNSILKNSLEAKLERETKDFMDSRFSQDPTSHSIWSNHQSKQEALHLETDIFKLYHGMKRKLLERAEEGRFYWSSENLYDPVLDCVEASQARALAAGKQLWEDAPHRYFERIEKKRLQRDRDEAERKARLNHHGHGCGRRGGVGGRKV